MWPQITKVCTLANYIEECHVYMYDVWIFYIFAWIQSDTATLENLTFSTYSL